MKIIDTKTGYTVAHAWCDSPDRDLDFALSSYNLKDGYICLDSFCIDNEIYVVINGKHYRKADLAVEKDLSPMTIYVVTVNAPTVPFLRPETIEYLYINPPKEAYTERVVTAEEFECLVKFSKRKLRIYTGD